MSTEPNAFESLLDTVSAALEAEQRISYRGLKRRFGLGDEDLEDLKDELIHARRVAADEAGTVLVWRGAPPAASAAPRPGAPGSYTPRHLAEKILSVRSAIEGENKQVTVLFCDVAQSMTLADRLGPEGWHELMNELFAVLAEAVHAFEGTVNQFTGDGVMALFGAPIAAEDHAHRACMAALRIRERIVPFSARVQARHGLALAMRIGLNSGQVVVGTIGDDLRMDYTAQGHVVGIAARLEALAEPNGILLSEFCQRLVAGLCEMESLGPREIKGVARPLDVFRLLSAARGANRFTASRLRGLTRFVGRQTDLDVLHAALASSQSGNGQVVGVVAEAGTGKSRLCHEFLESCRARGLTVLTGNALSHGSNIPYLPMLQVFRAYYRIEEHEEAATARRKIADKLLAIDEAHREVVPLVHELMGVADPELPLPRIDPDAKQRQLFALLRDIVHGNDGEAGTVVTCIEDLHWLDPASALFLEQWVEGLSGSTNLLLLSFRPGYRADWMAKSYYRQVPLAPLAPVAVRELLTDLLGDDISTAGLAEAIFQRTGGNPFFCEEIVQSLHESGDLALAPTRYRLNRPLQELRIPASVQSVLAARIDRLGDDDKALLQLAAVVGREFPAELLARVTGRSASQLARSLDVLKRGEFVFERRHGARVVYSFKHALTQEVALNSQLQEKRRQANARVAQSMSELFADRLDEQSALIAHHLEEAREPLAAAQAYSRAAAHVRSGDRIQHSQHIRKVLALTAELPVTSMRQQLRLQGLVELIAGGAWRFTMSDEELDALCDEARALAEAAGLKDLAIMIRAGRCAAQGMMAGDVPSWAATIDELVEQQHEVSPEVAASLLGQCCYAHYIRGNLECGFDQAQRSRELAAGDPRFGQTLGYSVLGSALNVLTLIMPALGRLEAVLDINNEGIRLTSSAGLIEELIWNQANRTEALAQQGLDREHPLVIEAADIAFKAHERAEQVASDFTRGVAKRGHAIARLMQGDYAGAEAAAQDCLRHCRQRRAHLEVEARCLALLADAQLAAGQRDASLASAHEAVRRAAAQGALYFECMGQLSLARALLASGVAAEWRNAQAALDRALDLAIRTAGGGLLPQVLEARATLAAKSGDGAASAALLQQALQGYRRINAAGHAERLARRIA